MTVTHHPIRASLAALLRTRRQYIREHALCLRDARVERDGRHVEYAVTPFDDADDWIALKDDTPKCRVLRHQRIQRLPRSIYGPAYYMGQLVKLAGDINASYTLLGTLPNRGKGTQS